MASVRMPISWRPPWLANLILARGESWIEVGDEGITARMGPLARVSFPRRLVREAHRIHWPWVFGFGIRIYGRRAVGLVGHRHEVVELRLAHPVQVRAVVPMWIGRLAVSVTEPERLISLLHASNEILVTSPRRRAATPGRVKGRRTTTGRATSRAKRRPAA
jgi:hypothetical protein